VQLQVSSGSLRARALDALGVSRGRHTPSFDFIALALRGKQAGFDKVLSMIDEMLSVLQKDQSADESKKEYCATEFDTSDDKKKELELVISDAEKSIEVAESGMSSLGVEIKALQDSIAALDKMVSEATEQRKSENAAFTELMAQDTAAKDLIGVAKNRLNKFYNPKLYLPPSEFAQMSAHRGKDAPPPPPESFGAYSKKSEESGGVIAMMDLLVKDLDKEMTVAETEEKDAQAEYEKMMEDSKVKRADDSKLVSDKEAAKAETEAELQEAKDSKASSSKELAGTLEYIASLHADCDWLAKYFDARSEARAGEISSLENAKAVLSGADFSFLQKAALTSIRLRGADINPARHL
jgi:chromosome segregation ATPase